MRGKLLIQALVKYIVGLLAVGVLVFLPAGTLQFRNGWYFMVLLFVPMFFLGVTLFVKSPELLEKRLRSKEKEQEQKQVISGSLVVFLIGFVVSGLDYRFGLAQFSNWIVILGAVVLVVSYLLYAEVLRENAYLSRTVEIQKGQKVIDTGLYGMVRHPMYMATTLLFLSIPVVLGSFIGFVIFLLLPFLLVKRIKNEEEVLEKGLEGYTEYKKRVKYRLFPFIW